MPTPQNPVKANCFTICHRFYPFNQQFTTNGTEPVIGRQPNRMKIQKEKKSHLHSNALNGWIDLGLRNGEIGFAGVADAQIEVVHCANGDFDKFELNSGAESSPKSQPAITLVSMGLAWIATQSIAIVSMGIVNKSTLAVERVGEKLRNRDYAAITLCVLFHFLTLWIVFGR